MAMKQDPRIVIFLRRDFTLHTGVSASLYREIFRSWPYALIPGVHVCAEANDEVIGSQIREVVKGDYDVAVTIGALYSQVVTNRLREIGSKMNVVCVAVKDPQELGLIQSFDLPGGNVTAVVRDHAPVTQMLELLSFIKPNLGKVMIPYFPLGDGGRMRESADLVCSFLERQGVEVIRVPFYHHGNFAGELIPRLAEANTVFLLESGYLTDELLKITAACCDLGVTCCVNDIDGVVAGAAVVFGEDMTTVGRAAHKQLLRVLEHKGPAGDIPVEVVPNGRRLYVNKGVAVKQGLETDSIAFFILDHITFIDEDILSHKEKR